MKSKILAISEVHATDTPVVYICHGLGSCIGLFVTDRLKKLSGGAHIPLPADGGEFLAAPRLIDTLLDLLYALGSDLTCLRAKVAGGASVFKSTFDIGEQNAQAVLQYLVGRKIFVAAADVGGGISRTVRFNSVTGELQIATSGQKKYCI